MPTVTQIFGQGITFDDGSTLRIPNPLTLYDHNDKYLLQVDSTGRNTWLDKPLSRTSLVTAINVLMLSFWIAGGKAGSKPEMIA